MEKGGARGACGICSEVLQSNTDLRFVLQEDFLTCTDVRRLKQVPVFELTTEFFAKFDTSAEKCGILEISSCNKTYQGVKMLPGYIYEGTTEDQMVVPSFVVQILYIFDDICEEDAFYKGSAERPLALSKELMHVMATGSISQDFLATENWKEHKPTRSLCTYAQVIHKAVKTRSPSEQWFQHFLSCCANYYFRGVVEVHRMWSQNGSVPSLQEYLSTRLHDGATELAVHIIEQQMGVTVSDDVHAFLPFREAKLVAMEHITLNNDLFSYHREVVENGYRYNTLAVMQDLEGFTLEQAIDATVRCLNHLTAKFIELGDVCKQLFADTPHGPVVDRYLSGLETWMSGYDMFQENCRRYRKPKNSNEGA